MDAGGRAMQAIAERHEAQHEYYTIILNLSVIAHTILLGFVPQPNLRMLLKYPAMLKRKER
jgi:hypothetical protein